MAGGAAPAGHLAATERYVIAGKLLLAIAGAFAGMLIFLVALHIYQSRRRRHFSNRRRLLRTLALSRDEYPEDGDWLPRGLDPAVLGALPVVAVAGASECAVCLAEFEEGEKARALPRCGHRFHVECIDAWFLANSTCPICRATVEAPVAAGDGQPETAALPGVGELRIHMADTGREVEAPPATAAAGKSPAIGRLLSGTDLEKVKRIFGASRSASF